MKTFPDYCLEVALPVNDEYFIECARRLKRAIELLHHMRDGDPNYGNHTIMRELIDELEAMPLTFNGGKEPHTFALRW